MQIRAIDQNFLKKNVKSILLLYVEAEKKKKNMTVEGIPEEQSPGGPNRDRLGLRLYSQSCARASLNPSRTETDKTAQ